MHSYTGASSKHLCSGSGWLPTHIQWWKLDPIAMARANCQPTGISGDPGCQHALLWMLVLPADAQQEGLAIGDSCGTSQYRVQGQIQAHKQLWGPWL